MKKVGILSMQRVKNYGSILQAFALKSILEELGGEVYFIDIKPGKHLPAYNIVHKSPTIFTRLGNLIKMSLNGELIKVRKGIYLMKKQMNEFSNNYCKILNLDKTFSGEFDVVVIGSDEVFNCCQISSWGYTSQLYGKDLNAKKVISYAGSFGHTTRKELQENRIDTEIGEAMKTMNAISVRDKNSFNIVANLTNNEPFINMDPVLMYDYSKHIDTKKVKESNYILIYSYPDRIVDKREITAIKDLAKRTNKKLLAIYGYYCWCDYFITPDTVFDVLAYFEKADFVITDTFHGTIFSIIVKANFVTLLRKSNTEKLSYLLNSLGLSEQIITDVDEKTLIINQKINYKSVHDIIVDQKIKTRSYLSSFINE
jgi:hypothetical protein